VQDVLDAMFEKTVDSGDYVIRQGDDGDNFYVIDRYTRQLLLVNSFIYVILKIHSIQWCVPHLRRHRHGANQAAGRPVRGVGQFWRAGPHVQHAPRCNSSGLCLVFHAKSKIIES
jgi:hypothetical protein